MRRAFDLTLTTALTANTSFRRRAFSTLGGIVCNDENNSVSNVIAITILDAVSAGNILANQQICQDPTTPLQVLVADLVNIVATGVETSRGASDTIILQWQFSADNNVWYDVLTTTTSVTADLGITFPTNQNAATITTADQKAVIDLYLAALIDPDVQRIVYFRLKTTRIDDVVHEDRNRI